MLNLGQLTKCQMISTVLVKQRWIGMRWRVGCLARFPTSSRILFISSSAEEERGRQSEHFERLHRASNPQILRHKAAEPREKSRARVSGENILWACPQSLLVHIQQKMNEYSQYKNTATYRLGRKVSVTVPCLVRPQSLSC